MNVDVREFGAQVDGDTDDYVAVQAALDVVGVTGGEVSVPPGVLVYSGPLGLGKGVTLRGSGLFASTLRYTGSEGFALTMGDPDTTERVWGMGLRDVKLLISEPAAHGLLVAGAVQENVENVYIEGVPGTEVTVGVTIDGGDVGSWFGTFRGVNVSHTKIGFRITTTGTVDPTSHEFYGCQAFCDSTPGSIGFDVTETGGMGGNAHHLFGGNFESCETGMQLDGDVHGIYGARFESVGVAVRVLETAQGIGFFGCFGINAYEDAGTHTVWVGNMDASSQPTPIQKKRQSWRDSVTCRAWLGVGV